MPQNFSTLILPATIAQEDSLRQLLLYFETIFLYSPMEEISDLLPAELRPLCCHYAPVPFGDGLTNFQQLIRDMTQNRAEYYGGGLSSMSAKTSAIDDESVWRLISRLAPQAEGSAQHETLLQARLLLKLAEIRDLEEGEIDQALAALDDQSQAMLHDLSDEAEEEGVEMPVLHPNRRPTSDNSEQRLRAWAHLFLADERRSDHWLVSTTPEVMAILTDYATPQLNGGPQRLCSLPLPGSSIINLSPAAYLLERQAWRQEAAECLAALHSSLKAIAVSGVPEPTESMRKSFNYLTTGQAWQEEGRGTLDFLLLPVSLPRLFATITKATESPADKQACPFGVVAVINPGKGLSGRD